MINIQDTHCCVSLMDGNKFDCYLVNYEKKYEPSYFQSCLNSIFSSMSCKDSMQFFVMHRLIVAQEVFLSSADEVIAVPKEKQCGLSFTFHDERCLIGIWQPEEIKSYDILGVQYNECIDRINQVLPEEIGYLLVDAVNKLKERITLNQ